MSAKSPAAPASDERVDAGGAGARTTTGRNERASSPHTRDAYATARGRLEAWLAGRPLDDGNLAAYLDSLREAGRAPATAAIVLAAVRGAARDAGTRQPDGPLTRQAIESLRRAAAAAPRRSPAHGLTAEEVRPRSRCLLPPAAHRRAHRAR